MKTLASWIVESLAATFVVLLCLAGPQVLDLPFWTLALSAFPMVFYLLWRFDGDHFSRGFALFMAVVLGGLVLIQAYVVPKSWRGWSPLFMLVIISPFTSHLRRKRKETDKAAPI